ncbi:MAG: hypothetical protein E6248_08940 [Clostridium sp.]|uniref:hypothetical protein n=1 Tax=Clostridium sp. TaxID=1506 RepID=UPI00290EC5E6|nr:hypothetical protein [Clostridium sp.]MDU5110560.1 hypothetical protein [Clostridium sp.]
MKKSKWKLVAFSLSAMLIIGALVFFKFYYQSENLRYSQEYVGQQGSIDKEAFLEKGKEFEIGVNKDGYAVFKTPSKALKKLKTDYKGGLLVIQKENNLLPINQFNYKSYKTYGWQITSGSEEERKEASFITSFLDIYENSFNKTK